MVKLSADMTPPPRTPEMRERDAALVAASTPDHMPLATTGPMELTVAEVVAQVSKIQEIMRQVMKDGEHFGVIEGTQKPTLYKPGAEKLGLVFRLAPSYDIANRDLPDAHREYQVGCTLTHIPTGAIVAHGVGLCSTMESKYRYRSSQRTCPTCGVPAIIKSKAEHPDIADVYNTVLKMAKKRAQIDAILTATAASDIFSPGLDPASGAGGTGQDSGARGPAEDAKSDQRFGPHLKRQEGERLSTREISEIDHWGDYAYGYENWPVKRVELIVAITHNRTSLLTEITVPEARIMLDGIGAKLEKQGR